MIGCFPTQALAYIAVFVYATHATQAIAFEWKPGFIAVPKIWNNLPTSLRETAASATCFQKTVEDLLVSCAFEN